jgi:hypothetical protein
MININIKYIGESIHKNRPWTEARRLAQSNRKKV